LITELVDVIVFILSPAYRVLYCGTAITELLGWRDVDIIDCDLNDIINDEDQTGFRNDFDDAMRKNVELLSYVRLKINIAAACDPDPKDVLFEFKGYPHFVSETGAESVCFFAMAKPYPSKNTAMLNTYLDLKVDNECLQQKLKYLKSTIPALAASTQVPPPQSGSIYETATITPSLTPEISVPLSQSLEPSSTSASTDLNSAALEEGLPKNAFEGNSVSGVGNFYGAATVLPHEEEGEDISKKKKLRKVHTGEQYVCITCGRTDSPEWRKGPLGPKTLCNACGLRWAKQMRKSDDPATEESTLASEE